MRDTPGSTAAQAARDVTLAGQAAAQNGGAAAVAAGGWFVARDLNGDLLVVRLLPRLDRAS